MERHQVFTEWKYYYCCNVDTHQSNLQIQCNLYENPNYIFCRNGKILFKFHLESQGTQITNTDNKKNNVEVYTKENKTNIGNIDKQRN